MRLTRSHIEKTIKPGDIILVHYIKESVISAGIQFASGGTASHALCCLGGMELVEADIGGVMHTMIDNYLTGKCRLTIKRIRKPLFSHEAAQVCAYWRECISNSYDMGMILHVALVAPIRRLVLPVFPPLGRFLMRLIGRIPLASHTLSTCAELGARGLREARPKFLRAYNPEDVTPEVLLRDATGLETVAVWDAPLLERRGDHGRPSR